VQMRHRADRLGALIRAENGVEAAVDAIESRLAGR
jgi:hypothetical protein